MNINKLLRKNIEFRIESLFEYNLFIESNIERELSNIQKNYDEIEKKYEEFKKKKTEINEEENDYYIDVYDDLSDSHRKIQDDILLKHRNSFVFLIFGFIENEFYSFAKNSLLVTNISSIDDLKGNSTFQKFKNYISKTDPPLYESIKDELLFFDNLRLVRNFITHHNNVIRSNSAHYRRVKEFSNELFELRQLGYVYNTEIIAFYIILNNKKIIDIILEKLNVIFDKMYLRN
ncbi:hypothetical protein [Flavobacterium sp. N502540]|uniref:hypothetical protein n=1 Tax=Flavobacterium sp. N502540 TaxID=2986838 RepID=UPI002224B6E1|nr:hypothetical protein [Flavobacterium sp. N502540]